MNISHLTQFINQVEGNHIQLISQIKLKNEYYKLTKTISATENNKLTTTDRRAGAKLEAAGKIRMEKTNTKPERDMIKARIFSIKKSKSMTNKNKN